MKLELRFPATPENARDHAQLAVKLAARGVRRRARLLAREPGGRGRRRSRALREEGLTGEDVAEALFVFGCYLGEVMVRSLGGRWVATSRSPLARRSRPGPWSWCCPDGSTWDPIGKAYKRLELGDSRVPAGLLRGGRGRDEPGRRLRL